MAGCRLCFVNYIVSSLLSLFRFLLPQRNILLQSGLYNPTIATAYKEKIRAILFFIITNLLFVWDAMMPVLTTVDAPHHHTTTVEVLHHHTTPTH
jgi:hypothetical protein